MTRQTIILLVDDNEWDLQLLKQYLAGNSYTYEVANDGDEALSKLTADPFKYSAVLLDEVMPNLNGIEIMKIMKEDQNLKHIPIIFQTSKDNKDDIIERINCGASYYVTKPIKADEIKKIVKKAIDQFNIIKDMNNTIELYKISSMSMKKSIFKIKTLYEANAIADCLSQACPEPKAAIFGLTELMVNAIEHGNLEVSYKEKSDLLSSNTWMQEIEKRYKDPKYLNRLVEIDFQKNDEYIKIKIVDEGPGFDWKPYIEIDYSRIAHIHGRGIATASQISFDKVEYSGKGNIVEVTIFLDEQGKLNSEQKTS